MGCEMCGADDSNNKVVIESVEMSVCNNCTGYGKLLERDAPVVKRRQRKFVPEKEESIERVRKDVKNLLKQHRERVGMDTHQLAAKMRIKLSTYQHYESGHTIPDISTAKLLEREIGVPLVETIRIKKPTLLHEESGPLTIGDMIKKKK